MVENRENERDEFYLKAAEYLRVDKSWKWIMEEEDFQNLLSKYKNLNPEKNLSYLADEVMSFGNEDQNSALHHFSRIRNGTIKKTKGLAIYSLAQELNRACDSSVTPFTFAEPVGRKAEFSRQMMMHLWELPNYVEKVKDALPEMVAILQKHDIDYAPEKLLNLHLNDKRSEFKRLLRIIFIPYLWLRSKHSHAIAFAGGLVAAALLFFIANIFWLGSEYEDNLETNNKKDTTKQYSDKNTNYDSRMDVKDAGIDVSSTTDLKTSILKGDISKGDDNTANESTESKILKREVNEIEKAEGFDIKTGTLYLRINIANGGYMIENLEKEVVGTHEKASDCGPLQSNGYYICQQNLPVGLYTVVPKKVVNYNKPDNILVDLKGSEVSYNIEYKKILSTTRVLEVGVNHAGGGFTVYGGVTPSTFSIDKVGDLCSPRNQSGYFMCSDTLLPGSYLIKFNDSVEGFRPPQDISVLVNEDVNTVLGKYVSEGPPVGALIIAINQENGIYTIENVLDREVAHGKASQCSRRQPGGYYLCDHMLPIGTYTVIFDSLPGFISPHDIPVDLNEKGVTARADYIGNNRLHQ